MIFSWLCYRSSHGQGSALTSKVVAERVHLSENTAKKYLGNLVDRGILLFSSTLQNISAITLFQILHHPRLIVCYHTIRGQEFVRVGQRQDK